MKTWIKGFGKGTGILIAVFLPLSLIEMLFLKRETSEITSFDLIVSYITCFGVFFIFKIRKLWIIPMLILGSMLIPFMMGDREVMLAEK